MCIERRNRKSQNNGAVGRVSTRQIVADRNGGLKRALQAGFQIRQHRRAFTRRSRLLAQKERAAFLRLSPFLFLIPASYASNTIRIFFMAFDSSWRMRSAETP
jgi:hypothetical protein